MDESLYDEFGNYIGPELSESDEVRPWHDRHFSSFICLDLYTPCRSVSMLRQIAQALCAAASVLVVSVPAYMCMTAHKHTCHCGTAHHSVGQRAGGGGA